LEHEEVQDKEARDQEDKGEHDSLHRLLFWQKREHRQAARSSGAFALWTRVKGFVAKIF
jgi:hypothetical protein